MFWGPFKNNPLKVSRSQRSRGLSSCGFDTKRWPMSLGTRPRRRRPKPNSFSFLTPSLSLSLSLSRSLSLSLSLAQIDRVEYGASRKVLSAVEFCDRAAIDFVRPDCFDGLRGFALVQVVGILGQVCGLYGSSGHRATSPHGGIAVKC